MLTSAATTSTPASSGTALLERPRPALVPQARTGRSPFGSGPLHPAGRAVRPVRIAAPDGLDAWRAELSEQTRPVPPTTAQVVKVIAGVRAGTALPSLARKVRLSQARVLDIVVGVGSRMSQANKTGPKADRTMSLEEARQVGIDEDGLAGLNGELVVVLGPGWDRNAAHGRDIGRAFAAVVMADPAGDDRPVERWLATQSSEQAVTYGHYAHLYAVATGKMRTFTGLTDDRDVREAYLRAFDDLADAVAAASAAVTGLCHPSVTPQRTLELLRACYWMVPDARTLAGLAKAGAAGDPVAAGRLRVALGNLRSVLTRRPTLFFPRDLSDLTARQFYAILAERGHHSSDISDSARAQTDLTDIGSALAAIRAKVNAGAGLDAAADAVTALASSWHGTDV